MRMIYLEFSHIHKTFAPIVFAPHGNISVSGQIVIDRAI